MWCVQEIIRYVLGVGLTFSVFSATPPRPGGHPIPVLRHGRGESQRPCVTVRQHVQARDGRNSRDVQANRMWCRTSATDCHSEVVMYLCTVWAWPLQMTGLRFLHAWIWAGLLLSRVWPRGRPRFVRNRCFLCCNDYCNSSRPRPLSQFSRQTPSR